MTNGLSCCLGLATVLADSSLPSTLSAAASLILLLALILAGRSYRRLVGQVRALVADQHLLARLPEQWQDALFLVDRTGRIRQVNAVGRALLAQSGGLQPTTLADLSRTWQAHDGSGQPLVLDAAALGRLFAGQPLTLWASLPTGARAFSVRGLALATADRAVVVLRDITADLHRERQRALLQQAALVLVQTLELETVLRRLLSLAQQVLGATSAQVWLADERTRRLQSLASLNLPPAIQAETRHLSYDAPYVSARAARTRQIQIVTRPEEIPEDAAASRGTIAAIGLAVTFSLPLVIGDRLVGVLSVSMPRVPSLLEQRAAIETFAHLCAIAIANAQAYTAERQERAALEQLLQALAAMGAERQIARILPVVAEQARTLLGADVAVVGIGDQPTAPFARWASSGLAPEAQASLEAALRRPAAVAMGLLGPVAQEGQTLVINDLAAHPFGQLLTPALGLRTLLGVPLRWGPRSLGALFLANRTDDRPFTTRDTYLAGLLAAYAGVILEYARLHGEEVRARLLAETILDSAPVGLIVLGPDGRVQRVNAMAEQLLGAVGVGQALPWPGPFRRPTGQPATAAPWASVQATGRAVQEEYEVVRSGQPPRPVRLSALPLQTEDQPLGVLLALMDLSMEKEFQRLREEWTALVAHDLRAPVGIIAGFAELLQVRPEVWANPSQARAYLGHIQEAARRLDRLVNDLLDLARLEAGRLSLEPVVLTDPVSVFRQLLEELGPTAGPRLVLQVSGPVPSVRADRQRLAQVLENLVTNAVKYGDPARPIVVTVRGAGDWLEVAVTNWGPGIPPEEVPQLFERFRRGRGVRGVQGVGLGLYITRRLVELHGGRIWVESTPGESTTFTFTLPAAGSPTAAAD